MKPVPIEVHSSSRPNDELQQSAMAHSAAGDHSVKCEFVDDNKRDGCLLNRKMRNAPMLKMEVYKTCTYVLFTHSYSLNQSVKNTAT